MRITVILCTYNRCRSLSAALQSLAESRMPESVQWEVLVVDNNSSDRTRATVEDFCRRFPGRFRYLFERQQGKSYALNAGIQTADGDILAFVDDDVTVEPTWLQNLTAPLLDGSWAGTGGRVLPERAFRRPPWLSVEGRYALAPLAIFDLGPQPHELLEAPFGNNMAFRKEVFSKYGNFRTDLGPQPGSEIRNEDTEFGGRLLAAGERFWYAGSAVVYHEVPQHRVGKKYILNWWFDKARADVRELGIPNDSRVYLAGIPLYLFRRLARWSLCWLVNPTAAGRFSCKIKVWNVAGMMRECYRQSASRKPEIKEVQSAN